MAPTRFPPGPPKWTAYRNVRTFLRNRAEFMHGLWQEYGDYVRFQLGFFDVYLINDPEMIRHVLMNHKDFPKTPAIRFLHHILGNGLLLSGGEVHRRQRRLMQPAFQPKRIATYAEVMCQAADETAARWRTAEDLDIHAEMLRLTLNVATRTLFHEDVDRLVDQIAEAVNTLMPFADRIAQPTGALQMFIPSRSNYRFRKARRELDAVIYAMIEDHRKRTDDQGDLLSTLIASQDDETGGTRMTDDEIRDETMTLFLAGHETTAVSLTWTWHLLAQHPEVEERLQEELATVLQGRAPTHEDVGALVYTRQIVAESLRLYPPAYLLDRIPETDWDNGKFVVPKGKYIFMSPYLMHRHPAYWPDPERFDPDRFAPDRAEDRPRFSYFPFGGGPRVCIGEQFAWTEMILTLATLAREFRLEAIDATMPAIDPLITLRPKGGSRLRVVRRDAPVGVPVG